MFFFPKEGGKYGCLLQSNLGSVKSDMSKDRGKKKKRSECIGDGGGDRMSQQQHCALDTKGGYGAT